MLPHSTRWYFSGLCGGRLNLCVSSAPWFRGEAAVGGLYFPGLRLKSPASLDEAIKKKFAKKEMLLAKNLATVKRAYEIASEWAEKNKVELQVGNPAVAA